MVLDDAVVDDDDIAGAVCVGMSVNLGRLAVGGPARVADAGAADGQAAFEPVAQVAQLADVLGDCQAALSVQHGDAGAVVAAVLQPCQAIEDEWGSLIAADVSNYAAHDSSIKQSLPCSREQVQRCRLGRKGKG